MGFKGRKSIGPDFSCGPFSYQKVVFSPNKWFSLLAKRDRKRKFITLLFYNETLIFFEDNVSIMLYFCKNLFFFCVKDLL